MGKIKRDTQVNEKERGTDQKQYGGRGWNGYPKSDRMSNRVSMDKSHTNGSNNKISKGVPVPDPEVIFTEEKNPQMQMKIFLLGKVWEEGFTKEVQGLFGENKDFMNTFIGKSKEEIKEALDDLANKYDLFTKKRLNIIP